MTTLAIRTEELTRSFRKSMVLDRLNLEVPEGAIYSLVGPNGAGKSTLIKLLMNILPPTAGTAQVLGIDSRQLTGTSFADIGYVSENQEIPEGMTVEQMLTYLRSFYPSWDCDLEQQLIRRFELPRRQKLRSLSRGMRMKAAFVSSFAYRPSLIVLDEPFSGLDPLVRDEIVDVILESAPGATLFLSTHDLSEIENVASHVGFLREGRFLCSEETQRLTDRFREVSITLDNASTIPLSGNLPDSWLHIRSADRSVSFIHSGYCAGQSEREVQARLPLAQHILFAPMNLRAIFVALAKSPHKSEPAVHGLDSKQENRG